MQTSIWGPDIQAVFDQARVPGFKSVQVGNQTLEIPTPFPSPADWRDNWIYFLLVDRFNNPLQPPRNLPWDAVYSDFQGGTIDGIRTQLDYLQNLGVGAIWISPVLKNCQYSPTYHGYGIQDFLRIDPRFASDPAQDPQLVETELRQLVDEAHARGIYIILDIVLHHTGDVFAYQNYGSLAPRSTLPSGRKNSARTPSFDARATPSATRARSSTLPAIFTRSRDFILTTRTIPPTRCTPSSFAPTSISSPGTTSTAFVS